DVLARPEPLAQSRFEAAVELDRVDVAHPLGEEGRQHAEPWADLEHDVVLAELGETADHAEHVLIDEEVLAERLLRPCAHGRRDAVTAARSRRPRSPRSAPPAPAGPRGAP